MKPNKSIDGLATRDAKTSASKIVSSKNLNKKPVLPIKSASLEDAIIENSLEIEVEDDFGTKNLNQKPALPKFEPKKPAINKSKSNELKTDEPKSDKPKSDEPKTESSKTEPELVDDFLAPVKAFNLGDDPDDSDDSGDSDDSNEPTKPAKPIKKHDASVKKSHKLRRGILITILVILVLITGFLTWGIIWGNDIIAKITGGRGNVFDLWTFTEETYEPLKTDGSGRTNILAFGTSGYNMDGDEGGGHHAGSQLTDSIMLISLNQETGDIAMLSLPRDLKASPTCTRTGKINEIYWCNGGGGDASIEEEAQAATALMSEVGSILGVEFQYFAHLNWMSLIQIVDTLGGITITLDEDIHDYYWTGAVFDAGKEYTINGEQALGLARARHGTMGGDFSRGSSQQKILVGIKNKLLEKHLSIPDLITLASTLGDNLRTNFTLSEIKTLANFSSEHDLENMRQISLYNPSEGIRYMTTGTIDGISYVLPSAGVGNYGAIQSYVSARLSNDPRTYENATIAIFNATDKDGLAALNRSSLEEDGYQIAAIGNSEAGTYEDQYTIYAINDKVKGTINLLEKVYGVKAKPASELPEGVTKDYDIIIVLGPSPASDDTE